MGLRVFRIRRSLNWSVLLLTSSASCRSEPPSENGRGGHLIRNCRTPTLILHGANDSGVPVRQGHEFFTGLTAKRCSQLTTRGRSISSIRGVPDDSTNRRHRPAPRDGVTLDPPLDLSGL